MARINVEDEWFIANPRRDRLIELVGSTFVADGMALAAWRLAQRYWKDDEQLIPDNIWKLSGLQPLLEVGLAQAGKDGKPGVYICGTEEQFEWLLEAQTTGAEGGKKSVESRRKKYGTAQPPRRVSEGPFEENAEGSSKAPSESPEGSRRVSNPLPLPLPLPLPPSERAKALSTPDSPDGSGGTPSKCSPFDYDLADRWAQHAKTVSRSVKPKREEWANTVRLMRTADGLSEQEIEDVFTFVQQDVFWKPNAVSLGTIRQRSSRNGLTKLENVLIKMRSETASHEPSRDWGEICK